MKLSAACYIFGIVFFISSVNAFEKQWSTKWPPKLAKNEARQELPFVEVPTSKLSNAIRNLDKKSYVELTRSQLDYYLGYQNTTHKSKYVILVRGIYMNGELGQFIVTKNKDDLWLRFGTYGKESELKKSALIVFLDSLPRNVYVTTDTG